MTSIEEIFYNLITLYIILSIYSRPIYEKIPYLVLKLINVGEKKII